MNPGNWTWERSFTPFFERKWSITLFVSHNTLIFHLRILLISARLRSECPRPFGKKHSHRSVGRSIDFRWRRRATQPDGGMDDQEGWGGGGGGGGGYLIFSTQRGREPMWWSQRCPGSRTKVHCTPLQPGILAILESVRVSIWIANKQIEINNMDKYD